MAFDIDRYKEASKKLDLRDIDWGEVPRHHLASGDVESMMYMMDIETHTVIFLSELLVSKACMDPVTTAFLSVWGYEEMYHGEAFAKFLRSYGVVVEDDRPRQIRLQEGFHRATSVMTVLLGSYLVPFFPAVYLTIGATNEMTTLTGYQQLIRRAGHPVLTRIVERIIKQERVHYAFYRSQAEKLMLESAQARAAVRWVMSRRFRAVGEGVKSAEEVDRLAMFLFSGGDGREAVRTIDRSINRLPGLQGIPLLERVL
ncbi:MAG: ferritin-like domain-containing protein, partial [Candidatus Dormibacteraceae bacterium]